MDTVTTSPASIAPEQHLPAMDKTVEQQPSLTEPSYFKWRVLLCVTALKLLLMPAYRSTDFEVHRNWMAITSSLPLEEWYTDATSEWTLDYPPLFAWFEWLLAQAARLVHPAMLEVSNLKYASDKTVYFQRGSVILTDLVLVSGAWYATRRLSRQHSNVVFFLIVANPGLLIVDHIHFQYNGLLLGMLIWSMGLIIEGRDLMAGILFAALVNMKHLFASLGPVYFVYLLRRYCGGERGELNFLKMAVGVVSVCAFSFGPFIELGQLSQVLQRLFPFGRGLCHAYWAANAWALYAALDKAMLALFRVLDIPIDSGHANLTGGLVGLTNFAVLPNVPPVVSLLMVILAMLPALVALWRTPHSVVFVKSIAYASLCSFMLGYHVHEKAVLAVTVPAALGAVADRRAAGEYLFLATVSTYALFPLLFTAAEYPIKVLLLVSYTLIATQMLSGAVRNPPAPQQRPLAATRKELGQISRAAEQQSGAAREAGPMLSSLEVSYLAGLVAVELYATWIHPRVWGDSLPFLPLMLISVYCAAGMVWIWLQPEVVEVVLTKQD